MFTVRCSLLNSSLRCDGNTCLELDLVAGKSVPGIIWEASRYLIPARTFQVGRYGMQFTWDPCEVMAKGQEGGPGAPHSQKSSCLLGSCCFSRGTWRWSRPRICYTSHICMGTLGILRHLELGQARCYASVGFQLYSVASTTFFQNQNTLHARTLLGFSWYLLQIFQLWYQQW